MLTTKRSAKRARKQDWYPDKVYLHFDGPLSRADATALVTSPENVAAHSFLPLITFDKRERRYRRHKNRPATIKTKVRKLAYCSNKDACIFSYYASLLSGQSLNKFNWLPPMTNSEPSAVCKITDSIEVFSNTVTDNTCIYV